MKRFSLGDYKKLKQDIKIVNQRIQKIQNKYGEETWSISRLRNKLKSDNYNYISSVTGNIVLKKDMSDIELRYVARFVNSFKNSIATTTLRGMKSTIKKTREGIKKHYAKLGEELSDFDVLKLYEIVEDKELRDMSEKLNPSIVWARMIQAKETNLGADKFVDLFESRADINDAEVRKYLETIYINYMNK